MRPRNITPPPHPHTRHMTPARPTYGCTSTSDVPSQSEAVNRGTESMDEWIASESEPGSECESAVSLSSLVVIAGGRVCVTLCSCVTLGSVHKRDSGWKSGHCARESSAPFSVLCRCLRLQLVVVKKNGQEESKRWRVLFLVPTTRFCPPQQSTQKTPKTTRNLRQKNTASSIGLGDKLVVIFGERPATT